MAGLIEAAARVLGFWLSNLFSPLIRSRTRSLPHYRLQATTEPQQCVTDGGVGHASTYASLEAVGDLCGKMAAFEPSLILISAGFDGYREDPMAE